MEQDYEGKIVLVTGAAAGIGRATALGFARRGAIVHFTDRQPMGIAIEEEWRSQGLNVRFHCSDATDAEQVRQLIEKIVACTGRLDIAVNNVGGVSPDEPHTHYLHESSFEGWSATMDLTLSTIFHCMKHELKVMMGQGAGVIANTASLAGIRVSPNSTPAYGAAKAAVIHMSRKAAVTYASHNIRINVVAPGMTEVGWISESRSPEQLQGAVSGVQPMGRWLRPEEVAAAFLWVCSDTASGVTGITVPVDGGWAAS